MMPARRPHYNADAGMPDPAPTAPFNGPHDEQRTMRRLLVIPLAVVASLVSGALIVNDRQGIIDVFALADPTGSFGVYFHLGGLAANLAVILVAVCVLLPNFRSGFSLGFAVVAFVPSVLEATAVLPCFLSARPGALCGVGLVVVAYASIPIVIVAAIGFVATSRRRSIKAAGIAATVAFLGSAAAAQALLAPAGPDQCRRLTEVTRRSNCLKVFAERTHDENICRSIEFRTTRFLCLHKISVEKRQPRLCDEIGDNAPIAVYESPAVLYRDTCFQNLAYAMHDHSQCGKIEDSQLRASCEANVR